MMTTINQVIKIDEITGEETEHLIIDLGNGEFMSLPKQNWNSVDNENA
jgi:hypothetical protein